MHKQRLFIVIAGGVGLISAFLTWVSISFFGMSATFSGISSEAGSGGFITLALCAAAAGLAFTQGDKAQELDAKMKKTIAGIGGAVLAYVLYYILIRMEARIGFVGIGVWLTFLSGTAILALPFVIKGDGNFEMPNKETIKADLADDSSATAADTNTGSDSNASGDAGSDAAASEEAPKSE